MRLDKNLLKKFNEVKQLFSDPRHNTVRGILKNSINPPCIPYFGTYLTSLTFLNERKTFLEQSQQENNSLSPKMDENSYKNENVNLINVAKCRKVYEIIGEIQLYQDQAYNLKVEPSMKVSIRIQFYILFYHID
uniref:Ras-GEF domain-containing protein n=1 Tax=Romanomermis culicivorax TaxID=13658 RepID=A0A915K5G5_ROMCU